MAYEAKGKITAIGETIQRTEKFKARQFELTQSGISQFGDEWENMMAMELHQDKCALLDAVSVGDEVNVKFAITSRKNVKDGKTAIFTSLKAFGIEVLGKAQVQSTPTPIAQETQPLAQSAPQYIAPLTDDDIPF